jgi:hypothetical protein
LALRESHDSSLLARRSLGHALSSNVSRYSLSRVWEDEVGSALPIRAANFVKNLFGRFMFSAIFHLVGVVCCPVALTALSEKVSVNRYEVVVLAMQ